MANTSTVTPECEIIPEGEEDKLDTLHKKCVKNPGHKNFIPISDFQLKHLPVERQTQEMMDYITTKCILTVRIQVRYTSTDRPDRFVDIDAPYPYRVLRGSRKKWRYGTGSIIYITPEHQSLKGEPCPCQVCENSDQPQTEFWKAIIRTATHVIYDEKEAASSTFDCFYDSDAVEEKEKIKPLYGHKVLKYASKRVMDTFLSDMCHVECYTHDRELVQKLEGYVKNLDQEYAIPGYDNALGILISHPHGCSKRITIGNVLHLTYPLLESYPDNVEAVKCRVPLFPWSKYPEQDLQENEEKTPSEASSEEDLQQNNDKNPSEPPSKEDLQQNNDKNPSESPSEEDLQQNKDQNPSEPPSEEDLQQNKDKNPPEPPSEENLQQNKDKNPPEPPSKEDLQQNKDQNPSEPPSEEDLQQNKDKNPPEPPSEEDLQQNKDKNPPEPPSKEDLQDNNKKNPSELLPSLTENCDDKSENSASTGDDTFNFQPGTEFLLPDDMTFSFPTNPGFALRYTYHQPNWFTLPPGTKFTDGNGKDVFFPPEAKFFDNGSVSGCCYVTYDTDTCPGSSGACVIHDLGRHQFRISFPHMGSMNPTENRSVLHYYDLLKRL